MSVVIYLTIRNHTMDIDNPLIHSVLIYMCRHPGGTDIMDLVGEDQYDKVMECLLSNGLVRPTDGGGD